MAGCAVALGLAGGAHAAALSNSGFETGDLSGWTATPGTWTDGFSSHPFVDVVSGADDATGDAPPFGEHYDPVSGGFFARLTAGANPDVLDTYTLLSQSFDLSTDSILSGSAAFLAFDDSDHDDDGYVRLFRNDAGGLVLVEELFAAHIAFPGVGDFGHTDWTGFTSSLLLPGSYLIEAGVRNVGDTDPTPFYSSQLLVDGVSLTAAPSTGPGGVPEPASWTLMIAGFGLAGASLRARRRGCIVR